MQSTRIASEDYKNRPDRPEGWQFQDEGIEREWKFADFASALQFVNQVGQLADAADHHPDISFGWGYARIRLTTHDNGGVTVRDLSLAAQINSLAR